MFKQVSSLLGEGVVAMWHGDGIPPINQKIDKFSTFLVCVENIFKNHMKNLNELLIF